MGTSFVFLGTLLLSQFVALLAALQLADHFRATEEFIAVMMGLILFAIIAVVVFAIIYNTARSARAFQTAALMLIIFVMVLLALPSLIMAATQRTAAPIRIGADDIPVLLELLVPALITILVQWGLVRRRWLRRHGEDDLSRWPWITTLVAGLAFLNPPGLNALSLALRVTGLDGLQQAPVMIALGGAIALVLMAWIEIATRGRIMRRRQPANS